MAKRKKVLGRGLGALLSDSVEDNIKANPTNTDDKTNKEDNSTLGSVNDISIEQIEKNPFQPRTDFDKSALYELAESIKVQGIIQPITVRQLSEKQFQLISGERRLEASKMAGLESIPVYIRTADDQQILEMAIIENIQRENLNPIEIALSYQRLISDCDLKQEELGDRVGKSRVSITNYLRLIKLPPRIQAALRDKLISMGHARAMVSVENIDEQLSIFDKTIKDQLSVRAVEELVRSLTKASPKKENKTNLGIEMKRVQDNLASHFGTKIQLKTKDNNKGEIKIPFTSVEDLNRILEILDI